MSLNLLRTSPTGTGRFRKKYIHNDASSLTDQRFFSCECNRIIYTLTERTISSNRYYYIQSVGISSSEVSYIGVIPHAAFNINASSYPGSFLCDGENIYITFLNVMNIYKINMSTISLLNIESYANDIAFNAYSKMQWYNDHTIALFDTRGLVLFDTDTCEISHIRYKPSAVTNRVSYAFSDKYIMDVNGNLTCYNREAETLTTINFPISSYVSEIVYGDGKFYVVNQAYVFIFDEETGTWESTYYPIPFGSAPKCVAYTDGVLYILPNKSSKCWAFDTTIHKYSYMFLPWVFSDNNSNNYQYSVATFRRYLFFQYYSFACINFNGLYKYRAGYKIIQYQIMCNSKTEYIEKDRCIVLNSGYLTLENVPELKPFLGQSGSSLKSVSVSKDDYKNIYDIRIL